VAVVVLCVSFSLVEVQVRMHHAIVLVQVQMSPIPPQVVPEDPAAQEDQHGGDRKLEKRFQARGHPPAQKNDG
jgi:hypothetical protein